MFFNNSDELENIVAKEFHIIYDFKGKFETYMADYTKNVLILRFNHHINDNEKIDWIMNYCEHISNIIYNFNYESDNNMCEEIQDSLKYDTQNKSILLILHIDFYKFIKGDSIQLQHYKYLDNVLIKYSDNLAKCVNSTEKISLIEILLRIHELFKYGEIKYIIINQFAKLVDIDDYLPTETKSILYSFIYSLILNINSGNSKNNIKIIIIE